MIRNIRSCLQINVIGVLRLRKLSLQQGISEGRLMLEQVKPAAANDGYQFVYIFFRTQVF